MIIVRNRFAAAALHFQRLLLGGALLVGPLAFAELQATSTALPLEPLTDSVTLPATNSTVFKLQNSQYVSSGKTAYRPGAATQNSSAVLALDKQTERRGFEFRASLSDEYSVTERWNYLDIFDLEASYRLGANHFSVGRKLDNWSEWDSKWEQGEFQARYMENGLRPQAAGLVGAFYYVHNDQVGFTAGFLPISVPDIGAHFSAENNKLESANPWFHSPPPDFAYQRGIGDLHYAVANDSPGQVIAHPGVVSKVELREGAYFSRLSYAYKPMPTLPLGFPSNGQLFLQPNGDYMQLTISPRVIYNRVVNWDNQYTIGPWQVSGSIAVDDPEQDRGPSSWTEQQVAAATIVSGALTRRLEEAGPHAARLEIGFLKVNGGDEPDSGRFAGVNTLFARRFQYYEAYMIAIKREFRHLFDYPVESELRVIYDRAQGGGVLSFNSEMRFTDKWRVDLELDFLGLLTSTGTIGDGFLSAYRANDRVGLGVSYVF